MAAQRRAELVEALNPTLAARARQAHVQVARARGVSRRRQNDTRRVGLNAYDGGTGGPVQPADHGGRPGRRHHAGGAARRLCRRRGGAAADRVADARHRGAVARAQPAARDLPQVAAHRRRAAAAGAALDGAAGARLRGGRRDALRPPAAPRLARRPRGGAAVARDHLLLGVLLGLDLPRQRRAAADPRGDDADAQDGRARPPARDELGDRAQVLLVAGDADGAARRRRRGTRLGRVARPRRPRLRLHGGVDALHGTAQRSFTAVTRRASLSPPTFPIHR